MIGDIIMNVSEKIRYYRELRGLTQQQLADFSGIPLGTLKKYEIRYYLHKMPHKIRYVKFIRSVENGNLRLFWRK